MNIREATAIAGPLGYPAKMPGTSYGISAHKRVLVRRRAARVVSSPLIKRLGRGLPTSPRIMPHHIGPKGNRRHEHDQAI
jgi:hypothetical protein